MPEVSVILPNYNYARYLKERVRSILHQTHRDLELIYVDDGSSDASNDLMQEFRSEPRLRMQLYRENSGRVYQRWNDGAQLATGDWLWFAGADDSAHPDFLSELLRVAKQHPSVALVYCKQATMDATGRLLRMPDEPAYVLGECRRFSAPDLVLSLLQNNSLSTASAMLLRRDVFARCGGFDARLWLAADWDLYLSMLETHDVAVLDSPLATYRHHGSTVTKSTRTTVTLLENAYCVARAASWVQRHPACSEALRQAALRRARARVFDLFADPGAELPRELHFAARAIHELVPDPRLRVWS